MRHGRWEFGCRCSECGRVYGPKNAKQKQFYNYCPNCGARMDLNTNNGITAKGFGTHALN